AGRNDLAFTVQGRNAASGGDHFGLDRVLVVPGSAPDRRAALERAIRWIERNPADPFDGGRADMGAEIATLSELAGRSAPGPSRDRLLALVRARVAALDALPAERVPESSFTAIARAAFAASAVGAPLRTVDGLTGRMEAAARGPAASDAPYRPIALA